MSRWGVLIHIKVCINCYLSCKHGFFPRLERDLDLHQDVQHVMLSNQNTLNDINVTFCQLNRLIYHTVKCYQT